MTRSRSYDSREDEVIIAVIGVTGAGKTSFISRASGRQDLKVGHGVDSCTEEVQSVTFSLDGKRVTLIDTPGFDDTYRSDTEILKLIATFLAINFEERPLLNGLLLLQPINQNRLQGSEMKRTRLFKKILGENAYKRVIIATTMWNQLSDSAVGQDRSKERASRADVWGDMVSEGTEIIRHDDNSTSALQIIRKLMQLSGKTSLLMQEELIANGGNIGRTSAGRQLNEDLGEVIAKLTEEIESLKQERDASREELEELQQSLDRQEREKTNLNKSWVSVVETVALVASTGVQVVTLVRAVSACVIL